MNRTPFLDWLIVSWIILGGLTGGDLFEPEEVEVSKERPPVSQEAGI